MTREFMVATLAETEAFGRRLGELLFPGVVLALVGQLGAGKTHLTRAIAEGLSVHNPLAVTSPTFVLIQEYAARLPIYHFDAYRLSGDREFLELGADEYFHGDGVSVVEWADRVPGAMPAERLEVRIDVLGDTARRFTLEAFGDRYQQLLGDLACSPPS
jgi:tRNA threonylcarbamoyladenosine biosynthesis protein TsaE